MKILLMVAGGGAIGSVIRFFSHKAFSHNMGFTTHTSTMLINIIGCFLIGILATYLSLKKPEITPFLITGLLGGFTTFSAFGLDSINLINQKQMGTMFLYVGISVIVGIIFTWFGIKFAHYFLIK